ncbi:MULTISPECIES: apolipoprotein A1/A4/E family protein [Chitinophaga]|uniref:apolipoprotein A1/A4/E family protein n=2 Tax=Chitinophagaceae TaxID=563835 RepID=UPI001CEDB1F8|nr:MULTISPECIES: apolipoprotein A1/A4/E family protein [Chitinophaga]
MFRSYLATLLLLCVVRVLFAQEKSWQQIDTARQKIDSTTRQLSQLPDKYFSQVSNKTDKLQKQLTRRTDKALSRFLKQEQRLQQKLGKIDSVAAKNIFTRSIDSLGNMKARLKGKLPGLAGKVADVSGGSGYLDTLQNSFSFLKDSKALIGKSKALQDKLSGSLKSVKDLQSKLQYAEQVKAFIRERRQQLKTQLAQYTVLTKDLQKINKEAYYYMQQVNEYKSLLKDRKKAEAKAMELLRKTPAFNDFMQRNSQWAGFLNLPGGSNSANLAQSLEGLQTRNQVEQLIQQRIGSGGPNARQAISQQMDAARAQFDELKSKFPDLDNAGDMPNFKPNEMKSKSFLQRLEFGGNIQFQKSSKYFPTTSDIAGQVAYKFSKNGSIGLGASYRLGMGTGWNDIRFSHQGLGLRSFADYKLKGTFFVNGGFEQNYNSQYFNTNQLTRVDNWQGSALLGVSKKYKISSKLKGNIMLLYDFLHNQHTPRTEPLKLRMGYTF